MSELNKIFANNALSYVGQGPSKFRSWFYGNDLKGVPWCAIFVSYIANVTGVLNKIVKKCEGAGDFPRLGVAAGWGKWYEGNTKPQVGDIILFTWNGQGRYPNNDIYFSDHVGIVYKVDNKYVYTVEGNANGTNDTSTVSKRTYTLYSGLINGYYRPNWDNASTQSVSNVSAPVRKPTATNKVNKPDVEYRIRAVGKWYPAVKNLEDYAGVPGKPITDVAIKFSKGSGKYRVHVKGIGWLPYVTGYNINDHVNGYAGNGKEIDAVEIYYNTPSDIVNSIGYLKAKYRVSPVNCGYYDFQFDNEKTNGQDGYAGCFGKSIDRLQITLSN